MLEPLTRLIEVVACIVCLCALIPLVVYIWYGGDPPPKIERLLERFTLVFERGADSIFSRLKRKDYIDVTPQKPREITPPEKLVS
jgi:hypothetical protein